MKGWITLALISAFIGAIVPKGKNDGIKKTVLFLCGTAVLVTIASPLVRAAENLLELPEKMFDLLNPDGADMESEAVNARTWVIRYSVENIENRVNALLSYRYGLSSDSVATVAVTDMDKTGTVFLTELRVSVSRNVGVTGQELARYVGEMLACPCYVEFIDAEKVE